LFQVRNAGSKERGQLDNTGEVFVPRSEKLEYNLIDEVPANDYPIQLMPVFLQPVR
jgi:hypothetical protein